MTAIVLAAGILASSGKARADAKQECAAAYVQTQALRDAAKLGEARKNAVACSAADCPGFIVKDCTQWLAQIDARMPSVVFEVRDASGAETSAVEVTLDGKPWLAALDGKAKAVDPGRHTLRYEHRGRGAARGNGADPRGREGPEAHRQLPEGRGARAGADACTGRGGRCAEAFRGALGDRRHRARRARRRRRPRRARAARQVGRERPSAVRSTRGLCTTAGANAESQGRALGPATTAALVVGGVGVGVAAVWLGVRASAKKAPAAALVLRVGATAGGAGMRLGGSF